MYIYYVMVVIFEVVIGFIEFSILQEYLLDTSSMGDTQINALSILWAFLATVLPFFIYMGIFVFGDMRERITAWQEDRKFENKKISKGIIASLSVVLVLILMEAKIFFNIFKDDTNLYATGNEIDFGAIVSGGAMSLGHHIVLIILCWFMFVLAGEKFKYWLKNVMTPTPVRTDLKKK